MHKTIHTHGKKISVLKELYVSSNTQTELIHKYTLKTQCAKCGPADLQNTKSRRYSYLQVLETGIRTTELEGTF